ncbi:hypothetical protein ACSSV4_003801 [Roseovarius sp. MBR-154]
MTPPDADLDKQKRRHRTPLIGMAIICAIGVGVILYWIFEESATAPGPQDETEAVAPADIREGDVNVPPAAPSETVDPSAPDVEVER